MKLLLTGGGTAGHILPCLALVDYVKDYFDQIYYVGSEGGMEKSLVEKYPEIKFYSLPAAKLKRKLALSNLALPFKLMSSVGNAKKLLKQLQPDVIFSKGGYASLPVALAAKAPLISHESDYSIGLANRLVKKKSRVFCCGFEDTARSVKGVYTGIPLRRELYSGKKLRLFTSGKPVLLVVGGSLGARALNQAVLSDLNSLKKSFNIIHLVGKTGENLEEEGYVSKQFAFNMADLYATADYVLSRGGATALCEIVSLKKPALIVPLPKGTSRGDQPINAKYYEKRGLVRVLEEQNLDNLSAGLEALRCDESLKNNLAAAKSADGSERIAQILKNAAAGIFE